jgi:hypothetical protein
MSLAWGNLTKMPLSIQILMDKENII